MTGDEGKFLNIKEERGGNVFFGDNGSTKIIGKAMVTLENQRTKAKNVLLIANKKHKLLSVSQMYDQRHTLTFDSNKCRIKDSH